MKQMMSSLVNVLKSAPKSIMGMLMLSLTTILFSCTEEKIGEFHPTAATGLKVEADSVMKLGRTDVTLEATAKDVNGKVLDGKAELAYKGLPKIYVETLGMPAYVTTEDGTNFVSSDGNNFVRSFSFTSNTGVSGTSIGKYSHTVLLGQLNDSTELVEAVFTEDWHISVADGVLPEMFAEPVSGTQNVRVQYLRVVKPADEPIVEDVVTWRMRSEADETVDGDSYFTVFAEKLVNGTVSKTWKTYVAGISFGTWRPNVSAQLVNSTNFTVKDSTDELPTDEPRHNLGTEKLFSVINHSKVEYHFIAGFDAPKDAEGKTERTIAGHINVWSNTVIFHNPETGEDMNFVFEGTAETTNHEVTDTNLYTRTVVIKCNGEVVDTQVGTVQLTVVQ
jgi:hypothetical protein